MRKLCNVCDNYKKINNKSRCIKGTPSVVLNDLYTKFNLKIKNFNYAGVFPDLNCVAIL